MDQSSTPDLVSTPGDNSVSSGESSSGGFKRKDCRTFNRQNYDPVGKENIDPNFFMFEIQSPDSACSRSPKKGGKCRRSPLALAPRNRNAWQYERLR
jgi:hypothetical protein